MSIQKTARRGSRSWLTAGALSTIASIIVSGGAVTSCIAGEGKLNVASESQTYRQAANRIEIELFSGSITATAGQAGEVVVDRRLQWRDTRPTYQEDWAGQTLRITADCPGDHDGCDTDYTLRVPPGVSVVAHTGAGDVEVRGLTGEIRLDTGSGDATINNITGKLWIRSGSGTVNGRGLRSPETDIDTGSDGVDLRYASAPSAVKVVTGSGEIRIEVPRGDSGDSYNVQTKTGSGERDVRVRVDTASRRTINVSTGSGGIVIDYA